MALPIWLDIHTFEMKVVGQVQGSCCALVGEKTFIPHHEYYIVSLTCCWQIAKLYFIHLSKQDFHESRMIPIEVIECNLMNK
jgi:hypothetical protein